MVFEHQDEYPSQWKAVQSIGAKLQVNHESLRVDSFDNAMAEAFNSLYKWDLIYQSGSRTGLDDVEFATLGYIDWFNHRRLHGEITDNNLRDTSRVRSQLPPSRNVCRDGAQSINRAVTRRGRFSLSRDWARCRFSAAAKYRTVCF